jgi:hypothetical protein
MDNNTTNDNIVNVDYDLFLSSISNNDFCSKNDISKLAKILIDVTDIKIGSCKIDEQYNKWMNIWDELVQNDTCYCHIRKKTNKTCPKCRQNLFNTSKIINRKK